MGLFFVRKALNFAAYTGVFLAITGGPLKAFVSKKFTYFQTGSNRWTKTSKELNVAAGSW